MLRNLRLTDESNPDKGGYLYLLMPRYGNKQRGVQRVIQSISEKTKSDSRNLETLIVGDAFPDLGMGLYGALNTKATFLAVGGSRLSEVLSKPEVSEFAGEKMTAVKNRFTQIENPQGEAQKGRFKFKAPLVRERKIIVGKEAFPGTKGPETILAYLKEREEQEKRQ